MSYNNIMYHDDQFFMTSFSQIKLFCQIKVLLLHKQIISVIFLDDFFTRGFTHVQQFRWMNDHFLKSNPNSQ